MATDTHGTQATRVRTSTFTDSVAEITEHKAEFIELSSRPLA